MNSEIRREMLKKRWSISIVEKQKSDYLIYKKIVNEIKRLNKNKYVGCYWPIENEVDCLAIINYLLKNNYKVCLPAIEKDKMVFKPIDRLGFDFETWKCLRQPKCGEIIDKDEIDAIFVPVIAFNKNFYRLGYGKNYYNNYLRNSKIKTIGMAFSFQESDQIILTENDIKLDKIITD